MKRSLLIAAAVILLSTTVQARDELTSGLWTYAHSTNRNICTMKTQMGDGNPHRGMVFVKYQRGGDGLFVQLSKNTWEFERGQRPDIRANLKFDSVDHFVTGKAFSRRDNRDAYIEFQVKPEYTADFLELFSEANMLTVNWPDGNEPDWNASMQGSRDVAASFTECVRFFGGPVPADNYGTSIGGSPASRPFN